MWFDYLSTALHALASHIRTCNVLTRKSFEKIPFGSDNKTKYINKQLKNLGGAKGLSVSNDSQLAINIFDFLFDDSLFKMVWDLIPNLLEFQVRL